MSEQTHKRGQSQPEQSNSAETIVCGCCGHTEDLETARELWAASYVGGHLFNWICAECWHSDAEERCRS